MRITFFLFVLLQSCRIFAQQWTITEVGQLPEAVTNNAVCEGWQGDTLYIYTFGGIDQTLSESGIHLRSYRFNTVNGAVESIPNMPDSLGKLGVAANRIGDIIYVCGGYHVLPGGGEVTSDKVHRFNTQTNTWMADAATIPVATDDHVQSVWRDSLLYLVTGWKNTTNIQHCQIYVPNTNQWLSATSLPNSHDYKSFGASGVIVGDSIYYFGGTSAWNFSPQNKLRIGILNPNDPTDITWSISTPDMNTRGYRMAATTVNNQVHWIGGSSLSYNFDGIDYNGTGVVPPSNRDLYLEAGSTWFYSDIYDTIPMDLRGIGNASDSIKYIMGGMFDGQIVSNKIYKLEYIGNSIAFTQESEQSAISLFPNPTKDFIYLKGIKGQFELILRNPEGKILQVEKEQAEIDLSGLAKGIYLLQLKQANRNQIFKLLKL